MNTWDVQRLLGQTKTRSFFLCQRCNQCDSITDELYLVPTNESQENNLEIQGNPKIRGEGLRALLLFLQ